MVAAQEGTARSPAALGKAPKGVRRHFLLELRHGDVVEKDQGFGALDHEVIDHHGDAVDPDGVEAADLGRQFDLGPDTIGGGHQDGVAVSVRGLEEPREAPDGGEDFGSVGAADDFLHLVDEGLVVVEVDAGFGVGGGGGLRGVGHANGIGDAGEAVNRRPRLSGRDFRRAKVLG